MDNAKVIKMVENGLVIIVLFIIIIVLFPSIKTMAEATKKQTAESSTQGAFNMTKDYYTNINMIEIVDLPFKIEYNKNTEKGYIIYSSGREFTPVHNINLKIEGKLPESGSVEIKTNGEVEAKNLKFGQYLCNKKTISSPITCTKEE